MHSNLLLKRCAFLVTISLALAGVMMAAKADELPAYMKTIAGGIDSQSGGNRDERRSGAQ